MAEHNIIGERGEAIALSFLQKKAYVILESNWWFQKAEIDIITKFGNQLVIVEVKTRTSEEFESPKEAVTIAKQKRIVKAADAFIQERDIDLECRFDIVSVLLQGNQITIEHIEDAFSAML
ncbi:MAG: YraN family protein [Flavobacteriales bacterium]|nr:YraN family protein [Flavobacteriales bacterium]